MADFTALKTAIQTYIKQNGNEEITGEKLQEILLSVVTTLGDSAINDLVTALANEVAARQNADGTLQQNITNEATARGNADTALQDLIDGITENIENGYVYAGIATPSSTPATGKVFYLALTAGTYTNFGNIEVSQGINILKYNGSAWSLDAFIGIDDELTPSSNKLPKSGNVLENIIKNGSAFDLSAYNAVDGVLTTYADLDAALAALSLLPAVYKQPGMSIRFVLTSDNKYLQYRLMSDTFNTNVANWQGVDDEPVAGSENLVKSGGVDGKISELDKKFYIVYVENNNVRTNIGFDVDIVEGHKYNINILFSEVHTGRLNIYTSKETIFDESHTSDGNIWSIEFEAHDDSDTLAVQFVGYGAENTFFVSVEKLATLAELQTTVEKEMTLNNSVIIEELKQYTNDKLIELKSLTSYSTIENPKVGDYYYSEYYGNVRQVRELGNVSADRVVPDYEGVLYIYKKCLYYKTDTGLVEYNKVLKEQIAEVQRGITNDKYVSIFSTEGKIPAVYIQTVNIKEGDRIRITVGFNIEHSAYLSLKGCLTDGICDGKYESQVEALYTTEFGSVSTYASHDGSEYIFDNIECNHDINALVIGYAGYAGKGGLLNVNIEKVSSLNEVNNEISTITKTYLKEICIEDRKTGVVLSKGVEKGKTYQVVVKFSVKHPSDTSSMNIITCASQSDITPIDTIRPAKSYEADPSIVYTSNIFTASKDAKVRVQYTGYGSNVMTVSLYKVDTDIALNPTNLKPVRFILISDTHYRPVEQTGINYNTQDGTPFTTDEQTRWDGLTQNERIQKLFNSLKDEVSGGKVDFVLSTGDTCYTGYDENPSNIGMKLFKERFLSQIDVPFFGCVGNHDMDYSNDDYKQFFGHNREFSIECGNLYIICPDSASHQQLYDPTWKPDPWSYHLDWMNKEVAKAKARNMTIAIASHVSDDGDGTTWGAIALYKWMKENDIHIFFVGHQHWYQSSYIAEYGIYRLCAGWFANRDPKIYSYTNGWGYSIIELKNGKLIHTNKTVEWNFADTQQNYPSVIIGDNGHIEESTVKVEYNLKLPNVDGAMYDVSTHQHVGQSGGQYCDVPPMIPIL